MDGKKDGCQVTNLVRRWLLVGLLATLAGTSVHTFLFDGSPFHKYITSKDARERVHDQEIGEMSADYLFGGGQVNPSRMEEVSKPAKQSAEESFAWLQQVRGYERWFLAVLLVSMGLVLVFEPKVKDHPGLAALYLAAGGYLLLQAYAAKLNGGKGFANLEVGAHAARYGLAILLVGFLALRHVPDKRKPQFQQGLFFLGAAACSFTFAIHGWEALNKNAAFVDLIIGSANRIYLELPEEFVAKLLVGIGVMDLVLAILVVVCPNRKLLVWMATWGLVTALSRPLSMGLGAWYETAARTGNFVLPYCLAMLLSIGICGSLSRCISCAFFPSRPGDLKPQN